MPKPETKTQGKPRYRLTMSTSLGPALHVLPDNLTEGDEMSEEASEFAAFIGIDWVDRKHDVCLAAAARSAKSKR